MTRSEELLTDGINRRGNLIRKIKKVGHPRFAFEVVDSIEVLAATAIPGAEAWSDKAWGAKGWGVESVEMFFMEELPLAIKLEPGPFQDIV